MRVYEFEAKRLLSAHRVPVPRALGLYASAEACASHRDYPAVAKVQVASGSRGSRGGVAVVTSPAELRSFFLNAESSFSSEHPAGLLLEEEIPRGLDLYVSLLYERTGPALILNPAGGAAVERSAERSFALPLAVSPVPEISAATFASRLPALRKRDHTSLASVLSKLAECFFAEDCRLLEINPLRLSQGRWSALDVKMELDGRAAARHAGRVLRSATLPQGADSTARERAVVAVNTNPAWGGSPCRYVELDGDAALLLSGGGASLVVFDTLVALGVRPGNYSEYSGNPPREKVEALTRIVLEKPGQRGLLIAGSIANFTLIDETMAGVAAALAEVKPRYPIIVRRGGPNEEKAREQFTELAAAHRLNLAWLPSETTLREACIVFAHALAERHRHND